MALITLIHIFKTKGILTMPLSEIIFWCVAGACVILAIGFMLKSFMSGAGEHPVEAPLTFDESDEIKQAVDELLKVPGAHRINITPGQEFIVSIRTIKEASTWITGPKVIIVVPEDVK